MYYANFVRVKHVQHRSVAVCVVLSRDAGQDGCCQMVYGGDHLSCCGDNDCLDFDQRTATDPGADDDCRSVVAENCRHVRRWHPVMDRHEH